MPLISSGQKILSSMTKKYGKRGESVFYATMNKKGMVGKWEEKGNAKKKALKKLVKKYS